jgi:RND superfamily putative drug exporter
LLVLLTDPTILSMLRNSRSLWSGLLILAALVAWSAIGAAGGPAQGRLASVQTNDAAAFLPSDAESTRAAATAAGFDDGESLPALVVVEADGGALDADAQRAVQAFAAGLADAPLEGAGDEGPATVGELLVDDPVAVPAEDGQAALVVVPLDADRSGERAGPEEERLGSLAVTALRELAAAPAEDGGLGGAGVQAWVSGPAGFVADLSTAFGGIDTLLLLVALGAVLVILALVYRSPVLPFLVILTAVLALALAGLVVYLLADAGVLVLNGQSQGILSILVVGAAVDYSLLVVARYREELRHVPDPRTAVWRAWRASVEPIVASAATVVAGLLCLLLSDLSSNRSLGPVAAVGIAAALLAALTLLPALLVIAGRRSRALFWPRMPRYVPPVAGPGGAAAPAGAVDEVEGHRLWSRVARTVGRRDRVVWIACTVALAAAAAFVPTFDAEGTSEADVFLGQVESVDGEEALQRHFTGVSAQPAVVVAPEADLGAVVAAAEGTDGVAAVTPVGEGPAAAPGAPATGPARVVDGTVRVDVTTTAPADSQEAVRTVEALREAVHAAAPDALVGGAAAERLDTQLAGQRDLRVIVPAVLAVVLLILVALLRSAVAAVLLVAANVLSFGATLGVAALVFDHVLGLPGADPAVPLYGFCFLVALGVDYSIFLMSRVREEAAVVGPRPGVLRGLAITGSVITSAGVVLAATFAALGVIPLLFLAQLAVIVAFGVLLDTLVVRSLLVPAIAHDLGRGVWWPGRLARRADVTA